MSDTPKKKWGPLKIGCFGILALLALPLLWLCYAIYWSFSAVPGSGNDAAHRMEALIAQYQPKDADGAAGFQSVVDAIELLDAEERGFKADFPPDSSPDGWPMGIAYPIDFSSLELTGVPESATTHNRLFLDRLEKGGMPAALASVAAQRAFARPIVTKVQSDWLLNLLLPELGRMRSISRYNGARMAVAVAEGDEKDIAASFDTTLGVSRAAAAEPIIISRLVAIAMTAKATADLRTALTETQLSAETLTTLAASLEVQTQWPPIDLCLEGERGFTHDCIQKSYTDDGDGDGRMIATAISPLTGMNGGGNATLGVDLSNSKITNIVGFFVPGKKETLAFSNELYDSFIAVARQPAAARRTTAGGIRMLTESEQRRFPILALLIPAIDKVIVTQAVHESTLTGTRLMLAIERYRAQNGTSPDSLDQLVPDFLAAVPTDPFTGTPYGYLKYAHPDEFRRTYLLYSYGNNFQDDGGTYDAKFNALAESSAAAAVKSDYIFNLPRQLYVPRE